MLRIEISVTGEGPREKVGEHVNRILREQMSASPWHIEGETIDAEGRVENQFAFTNQGRYRK